MSKRLKVALLIGLLLYGLFAAMLLVRATTVKKDFQSPAAATRDVYGFQSGQLGMLKKGSAKTEILRPASEPMTEPGWIDGENNTFAIDWSEEPVIKPNTPPERWVNRPQGDDKIELVAFASWVPAADDPLTNDGGWQAKLIFRDPATLEVFSDERLRELAVPESFRRLSPPRLYQTPILRLLFRTSGMEYIHSGSINVGDSRTGARVSFNLDSSNDGESREETAGKWTRIDTELLIWHDSPLLCHVGFLTGEAQHARLDQRRGAQVVFGDQLRLQWLTQVNSDPNINSFRDDFLPLPAATEKHQAIMARLDGPDYDLRERILSVKFKSDGEPEPMTLVRASSQTFLEEHCGLISGDKVIWDWESEENSGPLHIASIGIVSPQEAPLHLVFLPQITELTFPIAGIPDMPNSREINDLFDTVLPRISLPEDLDDAETQLLGFIAVGAQIAWESDERWQDDPPKNFPTDRTFRNETPQTLLNWYLENTPGAYVRYEPDGLIIHINEETPSWWEKMKESIENFSYYF
ncbi:MAG: hypothetical protein KA152_08820 [Verrucomicrobiales bacterium]|nr:hypothetical protein [Verrucomicrobiales bacterium]